MNYIQQFYLIITFCFATQTYSNILIITHAYNRPDFIEIQYKTFKKFLLNEYTFVVFNDAIDTRLFHEINNMCKKYDIPCYAIPQQIHDQPYLFRPPTGMYQALQGASARNSNVVQYSLDMLGLAHDDIVAIVDSDLFLVKPFDLKAFMQECPIATYYRSCCDLGMECEYKHPDTPEMKFLWIGLTFLNMKKLIKKESINFNCGLIHAVDIDAGGFTYYYVENTPNISIKCIERYRHLELICQYCTYHRRPTCTHNAHTLKRIGLDPRQIKLAHELPLAYDDHWNRNVEFFLNGTFIHYRCGSDYSGMPPEYIKQKTQTLHSYIKDILNC